jgi:hypothetical protein
LKGSCPINCSAVCSQRRVTWPILVMKNPCKEQTIIFRWPSPAQSV